jgi:protein TonB
LSAIAASPPVTPADRLSLTLCIAAIAHAAILLGIGFTAEDRPDPRYDTMEIVLVQQTSRTAPEQATVLAQANLEGGGDSADNVRPATPLPPPFPDTQAAVTAPAIEPQPAPAEAADSQRAAEAPRHTLVVETSDPTQSAAPDQQRTAAEPPPDAAQLMANSFRIAALSAEIKQKLEAKAQRPRRKFISASTHEYKYAAYMEAWRAKVERVGNLNYPEEARRRNISGSLILDVALNPDGTVNQVTVRRSSGQPVLDDAAIRIVDLAAPFAPFPRDVQKETDILHITRTWQFLDNRLTQ